MKIISDKDHIRITLNLWEKILGFHGNFKIPKSHVLRISEGKPVWSVFDLRLPGTFFPGLIHAGTYYTTRGKEYWFTTLNRKKVYVIELQSENYKRLILGFTKETTF